MPAFRYQHGDRPLDGFTIEHGVGRGGFGEVYYAVSDAGRQVALKAVQNYEEVELRGISHCMNLKNPHLVTIFDLKHNDAQQPFVIMEYVAGPSLRELLDDAPQGLGPAKAAYFVREIAKGLAYLHDCGIVHRDLKPHNVFYEDGYVKIGDYSLSKAITSSHKSGHTLTVGTVHYMAPEISMGRYDHKVDIYALGVLLHEMLTGTPPFVGDSVGEVLMKHVAGDLELTGIAEPFASVIRKAMARDPDQRYDSVKDLVSDLFGAEAVQSSVSAFDPGSLTLAADRAGERARRRATAARVQATQSESPTPLARPDGFERVGYATGGFFANMSRAASQFAARVGLVTNGWPNYTRNAVDPLGKSRWLLAAISMVIGGLTTLFLIDGLRPRIDNDLLALLGFWLPAAMTIGSALARRMIVPRLESDASAIYRMVFGGLTCLLSFPVAIICLNERAFGMFAGIVGTTFALDWRSMSSPIRPKRLAITPAAFAAVLGGIASMALVGNDDVFGLGLSIVATAAFAVQLASPFDPAASKRHADNISWLRPLYRAGAALGRLLSGTRPRQVQAVRVDKVKESSTGSLWQRIGASNRLRFPSLMLSLVPFMGVPIAGLQRFYVGKVKTGILWLCTLGFLGIGQLVDVIMISLGRFRDKGGRIVHGWTSANEPFSRPGDPAVTPVNHLSAVPVPDPIGEFGMKLGGFFLNLVGGCLLLGAIVLGLILALDIPAAAAAGVFVPLDIRPDNISYELGMEEWPRLVRSILALCAVPMGLFAVVTLVLARRSQGLFHMARVPLAVATIGVGIVFVYVAFGMLGWLEVGTHLRYGNIGPAMDAFLNPLTSGPPRIFPLTMAAASFVGGFFVLAWPAQRALETPRRAVLTTPPAVAAEATSNDEQVFA